MKQNRDTFWENIFHEKCPVPPDGGFNIKPAPPIPGMKNLVPLKLWKFHNKYINWKITKQLVAFVPHC